MKITPQQINHRLAVLWYAYTYGEGALNNEPIDKTMFLSSFREIPPEYLAPYPNPDYWPKTTSSVNAPQTHTFNFGERITPDTQQLNDYTNTSENEGVVFPTWYQFWNGNVPAYPPPYPPPTNPMLLSPTNFVNPSTWLSSTSNASVIGPKLGTFNHEDFFHDSELPNKESFDLDNITFLDNTTELTIDEDERRKSDLDRNNNEEKSKTGTNEGTKEKKKVEDKKKKETADKKIPKIEKINPPFKDLPNKEWDLGNPEWAPPWRDVNDPNPPYEGYSDFPDRTFEELCCIGFNPEDYTLEAIIAVKQKYGYGGELCMEGSFVSVGFFLIEPSEAELNYNSPNGFNRWVPTQPPGSDPSIPTFGRFIGEASVRLHDIDRNIHRSRSPWHLPYQVGYLHYSVRVQLNDEDKKFIEFCYNERNRRLPRMQCVLQWNRKVNGWNFNNYGVYWGDMKHADVQYPVKSRDPIRWWTQEFIDPTKEGEYAWPIHIADIYSEESASFNNQILFFSGSGLDWTEAQKWKMDKSCALFNPDENKLTSIPPPPYSSPLPYKDKIAGDPKSWAQIDIFCAGQSVAPNGSIFIAGGNTFGVNFIGDPDPKDKDDDKFYHAGHWPGLKATVVFSPSRISFLKSAAWSRGPEMKHGRWYPTTLVLRDGNILIMDGHPEDLKRDEHGEEDEGVLHNNYDLDIYNPSTGELIVHFANTNISSTKHALKKRENYPGHPGLYPRLHLLPNGEVFSSTAIFSLPNYNDPDYLKKDIKDEVERINVKEEDGAPYRWNPYNPQQHTKVSFKLWTVISSVLLPLQYPYRYEDTAVMVLEAREAFICNPLATESNWKPIKRIETRTQKGWADPVGGNMVVQTRSNAAGLILPDGKIMFVGGTNERWGETLTIYNRDSVLEPEIFDPATQTWHLGPPLKNGRSYHMVAILLYDGRILVGGGNTYFYEVDGNDNPILDEKEGVDPGKWLPKLYHPESGEGGVGRDRTIEIYSPPYINMGERPTYVLNETNLAYNSYLEIKLTGRWRPEDIDHNKIFAIRCQSMTHGFLFDQRSVQLFVESTHTELGIIRVRIPQNDAVMPPGYYRIFISSRKINNDDLYAPCSKGQTIKISHT